MTRGGKGVKMEYRNSHGDGPVDEGRVHFTLNLPKMVVWEHIFNAEGILQEHDLESHRINREENLELLPPLERFKALARRARHCRRVAYTARRLRGVGKCDTLSEEFNIPAKTVKGGEVLLARSIYDDDIFSIKQSRRRGYRRTHVPIWGYLLKPNSDNPAGATDVTIVLSADTTGAISALMNKSVLIFIMRECVRTLYHFARDLKKKEEQEMRREEGDVEEGRDSGMFTGPRKWWRTVSSDALEAGASAFRKEGAPRKWLRTVSSGAMELGAGVLNSEERRRRKEEKRKAFEATAPGWEPAEEPPPPPPGSPPPNNDIFDKLRLQREAAARAGGAEFEVRVNPLQRGGGGAVRKSRAVDDRKLKSLESFKGSKGGGTGGGGGGRGRAPSGAARERSMFD
jgi:hypothetical protein